MQRLSPPLSAHERPQPPLPVKSFARYDNDPGHAKSPLEDLPNPRYSLESEEGGRVNGLDDQRTSAAFDVFDSSTPVEEQPEAVVQEPHGAHDSVNELPAEIQQMLDRFLESLEFNSQAAPVSADRLSELFQNFYSQVEARIATLASIVIAQPAREKSPATSTSSRSSAKSRTSHRKPTRTVNGALEDGSDQQMLTATEVNDRRRERRNIEVRKVALQEIVERKICESCYSRIWRQANTDDAERDEKLRSRAAALSMVGLNLQELLSSALSNETADSQRTHLPAAARDQTSEAQSNIDKAKDEVTHMNLARYPAGKLKCLIAAHKSIVDALSQMFPATSSADEILPTLIFTLICISPETFHVVSNFNFIHRFRAYKRLDGEASYCLTNLEAAMAFLETVDISSIRPDTLKLQGTKDENTSVLKAATAQDPLYNGLPPISTEFEPILKSTTPRQAHRLSSLLQNRASSLEAASGAVLSSADSAFDALHTALDGSFKFIFGRMREKQENMSATHAGEASKPRTLEEARRLVDPEASDHHDDGRSERPRPIAEDGNTLTQNEENPILQLVGGRRLKDSTALTLKGSESLDRRNERSNSLTATRSSGGTLNSPGFAAVESMRNLGSSFNPLKGFSIRGFARPATPTAGAQLDETNPLADTPASMEKQFDVHGLAPPIGRFLDVKDARELNGFDIDILLKDYQRLAAALKLLQAGR